MTTRSKDSKALTYSAAETAEFLGISKPTLLRHAYAGTLQPPLGWVRAGTAIRFVKADVDAFLKIEGAA